MRTSRVSADDQYRLIMECRRSGLSDQQWCMNHDIKPGTFYNWVKRLRQKGCQDIPATTGRATGMFFASNFWTKLQNIFGHCCMSKLDKVAKRWPVMIRLAI